MASRPVSASAVGVSSFGAEAVRQSGLACTARLLADRAPRLHWNGLRDLPRTRRRRRSTAEAEGSLLPPPLGPGPDPRGPREHP